MPEAVSLNIVWPMSLATGASSRWRSGICERLTAERRGRTKPRMVSPLPAQSGVDRRVALHLAGEVFESLIDVGGKQEPCPAAVTALDGIDDLPMLPWNARALIGTAPEANTQRANEIVVPVEHRYGFFVLRDADDKVVELPIEILKFAVFKFCQRGFLLG